jgi:hypothetical protein
MSDLTIGKIVNNSVTLVLSSESADKAVTLNVAGKTNDFFVDLPYHPGFAGKNRCLVFVESVTTARHDNSTTFVAGSNGGSNIDYEDFNYVQQPIVLAVSIPAITQTSTMYNQDIVPYVGVVQRTDAGGYGVGIGDQTTNCNIAGDTYVSQGDIIHNGILCQSPFGKRLRVTILNVTQPGNKLFDLYEANGDLLAGHLPSSKPIVIKMRILFLDNDDLKE